MTRLISIEGNIGSGKSTFVKKLENYYNNTNDNNKSICFLQEPVEIWNTITDETGKTVIECFYADNKKYAFPFQMMAYISRLATIKETLKNNYDIVIMERSLFTDRNVFAKMLYDDNKINEIEYKIYNRWFDEYIMDFPDIEYIYIKTDPDIAFNRIIKRGRTGENIPIEYLIKCNNYHNIWLDNMKSTYIIDGNYDTTENPYLIDRWIDSINKLIINYENKDNISLDKILIKQNIDEYLLTFNGVSRGNPGLCGIGYVIWNNSNIIYEDKKFIDTSNTSNFAEYTALILGLEKCIELGIKNLNIQSDSKLVIKQVKNEWNVECKNIFPLHKKVGDLIENINIISSVYINSNQNSHSDNLANKSIDEYIINDIGVWSRA